MRFSMVVVAGAFALQSHVVSAQITGIAAGSLAKEVTCQEAAEFQSRLSRGEIKPTSDEILTYAGKANQCLAVAYNDSQEAAGSDERMVSTVTFSGDGPVKKVAFGTVKLSSKDEGQLRIVCQAAGAAMGMVLGDKDPILTPLITKAGNYSCGSYVDAMIKSDPLLIVAPTLIPGVTITKDVLIAVGVPRQTVEKTESDIRRELGKTGRDLADTYAVVMTGGLLEGVPRKLPEMRLPDKLPEIRLPRCWRVFGRKVCR